MQAAAKRFAKRAMRRLEVAGQNESLLLRHDDILGKAAITMDADGAQIFAQIDPPGMAMRASTAGYVGIAGDSVADGKAGYGSSHRLDDAGEFMSERPRWRAGEFAVEKMPVGAADTAGLDPHQNVVLPLRLFLSLSPLPP